MYKYCKLFFVVFILLTTVSLSANDKNKPIEKRTYKTQKIVQSPPRIDGYLNDPVWESVEWTGDFKQIIPFENTTPSEETSFKILYDDNNLYIAIRAWDSSPDSIVRRMSRRDEFDGDFVEINIDSYHDLRTGFSFTINASGVKGDEAITNDNNWDSSWDPIWYGKTSIDDKGWIAEMQIPLSQLRFSKKEKYIWGLQVSRQLFRHEEKSCWQFISPTASGWVHNFGEIYGINNIVPKKQKDLTPYAVTKYENYEREVGNPYADGRDIGASIGLDGKVGITNDLTLDFTINPDFGQVEADPSEVNLTTFETFFPEKRTFFIEGRNILSHKVLGGGSPMSQDNLFYSRRIGRHPSIDPDIDSDNGEYADVPENTSILGAFKLTGKTQQGLSIGVLESITQEEKATIYHEGNTRKKVVEPLTNYFAARAEQDFNNSNTRFGVMITSTNRKLGTPDTENSMVRDAYTGGLNFNHQWKNKTYYLDINTVFSKVEGTEKAIYDLQTNAPHYFQRPDADYLKADSTRKSIEGFGGTIQAGKSGNGKLQYLMWLTWRSPGLNLNDMGYMKRNDEIMEVIWVGFHQNEPFSIFRNANINVNQWVGLTWDLGHRYHGANINGHVQYKNYWCTGLGISRDQKSISTETLRGGPALVYDGYTDYWGHIGTDLKKKVRFVFQYSGGLRDGKTSRSNNYYLGINLQLSDAFKMSFNPSFSTNKDDIAYVSTIDDRTPERYIRGTIDQKTTALTFRFTYNISPDFTIQYYAMPFVSAGKYDAFKYISDPAAENYTNRYIAYTPSQIRNKADEDGNITYFVDEDSNGEDDYDFENPDFNVRDFNSNLVLRWEYKPGSILYVVWTQHRSNYSNTGRYSFADDSRDLFMETYPHDVFLVKLSYRFGL